MAGEAIFAFNFTWDVNGVEGLGTVADTCSTDRGVSAFTGAETTAFSVGRHDVDLLDRALSHHSRAPAYRSPIALRNVDSSSVNAPSEPWRSPRVRCLVAENAAAGSAPSCFARAIAVDTTWSPGTNSCK